MATRKNSARKAKAAPPDIDEILGNFNDARSILECAYAAIDTDESGDEAVCLRLGLDLIRKVYNDLEIAIREGRTTSGADL